MMTFNKLQILKDLKLALNNNNKKLDIKNINKIILYKTNKMLIFK
jgi:hypothetical protein